MEVKVAAVGTRAIKIQIISQVKRVFMGVNFILCVKTIAHALSGIDGVTEVDVDIDKKESLANVEKEIANEQFKKEIENADYKIVGIESA